MILLILISIGLFITLAGVGATLIITQSHLFQPLQKFFNPETQPYAAKFFNCPMCMGFWVGLFLGGIDPFTQLFSLSTNLVDNVLLGFISSGTSYLLDKMVSDEGIQIQKRW